MKKEHEKCDIFENFPIVVASHTQHPRRFLGFVIDVVIFLDEHLDDSSKLFSGVFSLRKPTTHLGGLTVFSEEKWHVFSEVPKNTRLPMKIDEVVFC